MSYVAIHKKNTVFINEKIKADKVMLIGQSGEKLGLLDFDTAIAKAQQDNIDLVQVSPGGTQPVVCKLMDYGKHVFFKKKNISSSKTKTKRTS